MSGAIGLCVLAACVGPALGATRTWDNGGDGESWNDDANWSNDMEPGPSDRAVIPNGSTYSVVIKSTDDLTVDTIEIGADAELTIEEGGKLTLENDDNNICGACGPGANHHHVNGDIILEARRGRTARRSGSRKRPATSSSAAERSPGMPRTARS